MANDTANLSRQLMELLQLEHAPVAITFHDTAPANGVALFRCPDELAD